MADRRTLSSTLSADLLQWLIARGHSQVEIARMLGVGEPFISLVKSRERSLTLDHLATLADALGLPLGAILIHATERDRKTPESAALMDLTEKLIRKADAVRGTLRQRLRTRSKAG
jgi:transcriptional regulator with XRE-family HTH domain